MSTAQPPSLTDRAFLAELEGLRVLSRKLFRGQMRGDRRSRSKGQSVEFVDFRPYISGDDLRRIDWNLYGRMERHYVKLFEEEEDLRLYIILDRSASMAYGTPSKFEVARRLAAGLAHIVLSSHETVSVSVFASDYQVIASPTRGRGKIHQILRKLAALTPEGSGELAPAVARFASHTRRSGMVVVISDFLLAESSSVLAPLLGSGHQIELVQVLAPEELNPALTGDLELVDSESGERVEVSMGLPVLRRYQQRLTALQDELKRFALRAGGDYFLYDTSVPLTEFVLGQLRRGKLVR